jgi:hypothetical protein
VSAVEVASLIPYSYPGELNTTNLLALRYLHSTPTTHALIHYPCTNLLALRYVYTCWHLIVRDC